MNRPTELRWFRASAYAIGYLAVCAAISVLPMFRMFDAHPGSTAELVALLLVGAIFLIGLMVAWFVHRSWKLCVTFLVLAYPAFLLAFLLFAALTMTGLGRL